MGEPLRECDEVSIVAVCCVCGDVRDDIDRKGSWSSLAKYAGRYGVDLKSLLFAHTFCPLCFMHYKECLGLESARMTRA